MVKVHLSKLELLEGWFESDPNSTRMRAQFPFFGGNGADNLSVVYFEIEPGHRLGIHTDSAEEAVLILSGTVEATIGDERGLLSQGELGIIPAMVPHGMRNVGDETVRVVRSPPPDKVQLVHHARH